MKKILNFMFLAGLITLYSCQKNTDPINVVSEKGNSLFSILTGVRNDLSGNITITSTHAPYSESADAFDLNGYFIDKKGSKTKADVFKIGSIDVNEEPNFRYYKPIFGGEPNFSSMLSECFGKEVKVIVNSKEFGNLAYSFYSPAYVKVELSADVMKSLKFDKSKGLTLKWSPESGLSSRGDEEKKVGVAVVYHAGSSSNYEQTGMPKENVTAFKLVNDSAGEVTFTPEELSKLPANGYATAYVARANQDVVTSSAGQKVGITSYSMGYSPEIKAQAQ
jgi:hypothetical protein